MIMKVHIYKSWSRVTVVIFKIWTGVSVSAAVSFLLLLPGLNQHGVITKYASMAKREINKLLKQKEKKNE